MSGTGGSPQRETSITENPPLNGGGEAENIGAGVTESKSPTDMKQVCLSYKIKSKTTLTE